jgi:hypothetical protein
MAKFNYLEIHRSIARSKQGERRVRTVWENRVNEQLPSLLEDFDNHPVTKEIQAGPSPQNKSISGALEEGNLFSFLGFDFGDNPTAPVREVIQNEVRLATGVRKEPTASKTRFRFSLRIPTQKLNEVSKLRWESGKSWINAVQNGIGGFSNYLWKKFIGPRSHSFYGIQAKHSVRGGDDSSKPVPYLKQLFANFVERLKR